MSSGIHVQPWIGDLVTTQERTYLVISVTPYSEQPGRFSVVQFVDYRGEIADMIIVARSTFAAIYGAPVVHVLKAKT